MSGVVHFALLTLRSRARRIGGLLVFAAVFLLAALTARALTGGGEDHLDLDRLFQFGGSTLVSALLLLGWLIGRFGALAALVLLAGSFGNDHAAGHARLFAARPVSLPLLYAGRWLVLTATAFLIGVAVLPLFDLILLGHPSGWGVVPLVAAQVLVFASLTALLGTFTRADAWLALLLGIVAAIWEALRRMDFMQAAAPAVREVVSFLLPPQGALYRLETAFAGAQPVPIDALLYTAIYAALLLLLAGLVLSRREL